MVWGRAQVKNKFTDSLQLWFTISFRHFVGEIQDIEAPERCMATAGDAASTQPLERRGVAGPCNPKAPSTTLVAT